MTRQVALPNNKTYTPAPEPRATYRLKPGRSSGQYTHEKQITATFLPGAEDCGLFCVSTERGAYYLKQDGREYWGGGLPNGVPTIFRMHMQSESGSPWLLEIYGATLYE